MANRTVLVPVLLCGMVAACDEMPVPTDAPGPAFSYPSPGCFAGLTATQVCQSFHGPSAAGTAFCRYGDCLTMNYAEFVKVVAADEKGEYPRTWFAWSDGTLAATVGTPPCVLREEGKTKTRVEIPVGYGRCLASATVGFNAYYEHFASNPTTQCLAWVECKVPVAAAN